MTRTLKPSQQSSVSAIEPLKKRITPTKPLWFNRDRFVLAAGHGSGMLYPTLHLSGYKLSMDDLKQFRQLNSLTPGHPEYLHTEGIDSTSGPLGQGIAMAVSNSVEKLLKTDSLPKK